MAASVALSKPVLVFDGHCGVCTRLADLIRRWDTRGLIEVAPNQQPGLARRVGLTRQQVDAAAWLIYPNGPKLAGAAAINGTFALLGGPLAPLYGFYRLPVIRQIQDLVYHQFAIHRGKFSRFGSVPECERPGTTCVDPD
jgi:predicted DCC family thiol-disulfide oxidoreductase YuxK